MFRSSIAIGIFLSLLAQGWCPATESSGNPAASQPLLTALVKSAPAINPNAVQTALNALAHLQANGTRVRSDVLMVIDYNKPSTEPRLWVFDLKHARVLFHELVAHGKNTGEAYAARFSNKPGSLMSSLGVFLTGDTYIGSHGLSLRLQGLEKGVNDKSLERAIVIHAADYVSDTIGRQKGRIGRSWGCPAVRPEVSRQLIDTVKGGALLVSYYRDKTWLTTSQLIRPS